MFDSSRKFIAAAKVFETLAKEYEKSSSLCLYPLSEPCHLPVLFNRKWKNMNENAWSDWLAWILQLACMESLKPLVLINRLFSCDHKFDESCREYLNIEREFPVDIGHLGQSGRLDLLAYSCTQKIVWHVEVKITEAESADLLKNDGYVKALEEKYRGYSFFHFLLVLSARHPYYGSEKNFKVVTWSELAVRLRHCVSEKLTSVVASAHLLTFAALIEQKLIGLSSSSLGQIKQLQMFLDSTKKKEGTTKMLADNFFAEGLMLYSDVNRAKFLFEKQVMDVTNSVMNVKKASLIKAFEIKKLDGGGFYRNSPEKAFKDDLGISNWWAWLANQYWINQWGGVHFYSGMIFNGKNYYAVVCFAPRLTAFRNKLRDALKNGWENLFELSLDYLPEIIIKKVISEGASAENYQGLLTELIEEIEKWFLSRGGLPAILGDDRAN